jgi:hypothetical protein
MATVRLFYGPQETFGLMESPVGSPFAAIHRSGKRVNLCRRGGK